MLLSLVACTGFAIQWSLLTFAVFKYTQTHPYLWPAGTLCTKRQAWLPYLIPILHRIPEGRFRQWLKLRLNQAGLHKETVERFMAQIIFNCALVIILELLYCAATRSFAFWMFLPPVACFVLQLLMLADRSHQNVALCTRDLPAFVDFLALGAHVGLDFNRSVELVCEELPGRPLTDAFTLALTSLHLGESRLLAIQNMAARFQTPAFFTFTNSMTQSLTLGRDVTKNLMVVGESLRDQRFRAAEEAAGKVSVRMMIPLLLFVLPAVLIVLLAPLILTSPLIKG